MNHQAILKRAWKILFSYRTLWVFGFIVALTTASMRSDGGGGGGQSSNHGNGNNLNFNFDQAIKINPDLSRLSQELDKLRQQIPGEVTPEMWQSYIWIGVAVLAFLIILGVIFAIGHHVSKVALIRMVNGYEDTGEKITWKQGFRIGWSRAAWRLFLINLTIFGMVLIGILLTVGCVGIPLIMGSVSGFVPTIGGIVGAIGLLFLIIFAAIIISLAISLVLETVQRVCVLKNLGVRDSIVHGWKLVRANLKDIFLMWLILVGIQIGFLIVMIPVLIVLLGIGLVIGGGLGAGLFFIGRFASGENAGWIAAAIGGGLLFLAILGLPLTLLGGLKETYLSSAWTLAYRELQLPGLPAIDVIGNGPEVQTE
jgi:hypothetical protein